MEDKPNILWLHNFPVGGGDTIDIIQDISTNYNIFGVYLLNDERKTIMRGIECQHHLNTESINEAIFERWLDGKGRRPITWSTLVTALRDAKLHALADQIEGALLLSPQPQPVLQPQTEQPLLPISKAAPANPPPANEVINETPQYTKLTDHIEPEKKYYASNMPEDIKEKIEAITIIIQACNENELQASAEEMIQEAGIIQVEYKNGIKLYLGKFADRPCGLVVTGQGKRCKRDVKKILSSCINAKLVIGIGVAAGLGKKVKFGDVLIATKIAHFDEGKVQDDGIIPRAETKDLKDIVENVFSKAALGFKWDFQCTRQGRISKYFHGLIASGPYLVDSKLWAEKLQITHAEAIGYEMEGHILQQIADKMKDLDFVIIKGVCDRANGSKSDDWQYTAAKAAARYTKERLRISEIYKSSAAPANPPPANEVGGQNERGKQRRGQVAAGGQKKRKGSFVNFDPMDAKIIPEHIALLAGNLPQWNIVAQKVGMGQQDIEDIKTDYCSDADRRRIFLSNWIDNKGNAATYRVLHDVLIELGERGAAEKIPKFAADVQHDVPPPPTGLTTDYVKTKSMTISWQPPQDVNGIIRGYQVSYTPHGESECLHDVVGDTTSTELTNLKPHTEYTIRVRAKTVDFGDYSTPITVSTLEEEMLAEKLSQILANYEHISFHGFKIGKLFFYGTPRAGKTTLRKNLVKNTADLLCPSDAPEPSTYIAEISDPILIEPVEEKYESVQRILAKNEENNEWRWTVQGLDDVAKTLLQSLDIKLSNNEVKQHNVPIPNSKMEGALYDTSIDTDGYQDEQQSVQRATPTSTSGSAKASVHTAVEEPNHQVSTLPVAIVKQNDSSTKIDIKQLFLDAIKTNKWSEVRSYLNILDNAMLLQVIDGGGQPSFQEIFPLLISCPAVKLLIFKLTDELHTPYPAEYQPKQGRAQIWDDNGYVVKDFIFQAISSLPDLTITDISTKNQFNPKLLLVGTHRDKLEGSEEMKTREIKKIAASVQDLINESKALESQAFNWIKGKDMEDFIVGVSNTNQNDIMEVKIKIEQLISQTKPIGIPAPWLIFDFVLHKYAKSKHLHKIEREVCNEIAKVCHLKDDEIEYVLYFLHNTAGTILYYYDIPELKNWIITDFQLIIDSISEIIIQYLGDNGNAERTGQLKIESLRSIDGYLEVNQLLSLLKHRHIISYKDKATTFFMPSLLPKTKGIPVSSQSLDSLLVIFESGYSTIGLFCAVSTKLIDLHNWEINTDVSQCRNHMSFYYVWSGERYCIVFTAFSTYYEVHLTSMEYPPKIKLDIYKAIHASFTAVCKDMLIIPPLYGFYCTRKGADCPCHEHTAKVGDGYEKMECCYSGVQSELTEQQKTWFHQVNCQDQMNDCRYIPADIMVHCLATDYITVDNAGYIYNNDVHKFSIQFPPGAISLSEKVIISIGIMLHGPFIFPSDMNPISPIYWICCHPVVKLLKHVKFRLPHIMDCEGLNPAEIPISFAKALHHKDTNSQHRKKMYSFEIIDKATLLPGHQAEFETDHFCFTCLMERTDKRTMHLYCCIPIVKYKESEIHLVVTYLFDECIQSVKEKMNGLKVLPSKTIKLNSDVILKVRYKESPNWTLSFYDGKDGITTDEVDFWKYTPDDLKTMEKHNMYPPRFVIKVQCETTMQGDQNLQLFLEGGSTNLWSFDIPLALIVGDRNERAVETVGEAAAGGGKKREFFFAKIVDAHILKVAGSLPHWHIVAKILSFGEQDIQDIEDRHREEDRRIVFLRKWIAKNGNKATYVKMYTALVDLGEQGAADKIREIASEQ